MRLWLRWTHGLGYGGPKPAIYVMIITLTLTNDNDNALHHKTKMLPAPCSRRHEPAQTPRLAGQRKSKFLFDIQNK